MRQIYEYHPTIGMTFIPGLKARVPHEGGGYLVRINSTGFRCDHEFEKHRPSETRRILLFGDSFTAGEGVSNGERYGDFLESQLPNLQVYNFGLPATGTDQHFLIYKEFATAIESDLLVIAIFVENIRRVAARYRYFMDDRGERVLYAKPYYMLNNGKLTLMGVPPPKQPLNAVDLPPGEKVTIFQNSRFPRLRKMFLKWADNPRFKQWIVNSGLKEKLQRLTRYQPITDYDRPDNPAWLTMREIIREWISSYSGPVLVMPIPLYHHVADVSDPTNYQKRLREAAESAGAAFFDPLDDLRRYSREERRSFYFEKDNHLTRLGHEAVAKAVAPVVERLMRVHQER